VRIAPVAAVLLPIMLSLCTRAAYEPRPVYLLNCRLINSGHWMLRQHCKADSRERHHRNDDRGRVSPHWGSRPLSRRAPPLSSPH